MGLLDLIRSARGVVRSRRIALLLVAATLFAEVLDVLAEGASGSLTGTATVSGAEAVAAVAGVVTAGLLGGRIRGRRPRTNRVRTTALLVGAIATALVVHEAVALGLDAGHGEALGPLLVHVVSGVLPVAVVLGLVVALLAGVHVVRRVVTRLRGRRAADALAMPSGPRRRLAPRRDVVPPGLLPALHLAGRAPPVARA